jgi:hypothetical protein
MVNIANENGNWKPTQILMLLFYGRALRNATSLITRHFLDVDSAPPHIRCCHTPSSRNGKFRPKTWYRDRKRTERVFRELAK